MKIKREIERDPVTGEIVRISEFDITGNKIYIKYTDGEIWHDYDKKGNEIHSKFSICFENWREYDENNNEIHYKDTEGLEEWRKYDDQGREVYYKQYKDMNTIEYSIEYNDKGLADCITYSDGSKYYYHYDDNGNLIDKEEFEYEFFEEEETC